ncbi:major facilitator superfamily domain-containing protein [Chiua virens]|nr:major facilitator superfamily domain-containing protein [Chiua virens]
MNASDPEEKSSQTQVDSAAKYDSIEDHRLRRKVDGRLLPILTLLYLLSFLDRTNIGNAKLDGLTTVSLRILSRSQWLSLTVTQDLGVSAPAYNTSLALYFVGYVLFEIPANASLKRFDPQFWLPTLTLVWGIVSIGQGLVTDQAGLFGIRFLLGVAEAGLFPGVVYVFSVYYLRRERSWRVAVFFGGAALAGAFGGIFAYVIGLMNGVGGRKGWQWIFILEGILTALVSIFAYFVVPTWSYKAKFLTEEERDRLLEKLRADSDAGTNQSFQWSSVRSAFEDHLVWAYALLFHGFSFVLYSVSLFLPTIIADLGFQTWQAQLMTVPPYTVASLSLWAVVWLSSRWNMRAPFIITGGVVAIIGKPNLLYEYSVQTNLQGISFLYHQRRVSGITIYRVCRYINRTFQLVWPSENVSGQTKRAVAVALQIAVGDIAAIAGCLIYRPSLSAHLYRIPNLIAIGYMLSAILTATYLWVMMAAREQET